MGQPKNIRRKLKHSKEKAKEKKTKKAKLQMQMKKKNPPKKWRNKKTAEVSKMIETEKPTKQIPKKSMKPEGPKKTEKESLRNRMLKRLEAARFRQINEELDQGAVDSNPQDVFSGNVDLFQKYHTAYRERVEHWPSNPLDIIKKYVNKKLPEDRVIADFGCGEALLAASVPHKVHSFDLFALNDRVVACDMSSTPLNDGSVDLVVFCLSLMGTDVAKYIAEANRVLKQKGHLKIAEVASRFPENNANGFVRKMKKFGFVTKDKVQQGNLAKEKKDKFSSNPDVFLMLDFLKIRLISKAKSKLPPLKLLPCSYKKR